VEPFGIVGTGSEPCARIVAGPRLDWAHPRGWVVAAAAAAWAWMAAVPHQPMAHAGQAHHHAPDLASPGWMMMAVMVVAMMMPMSLVHVGDVAMRSPGRRHRAAALFLLGYLLVWIAAQAVIAGAVRGIATVAGWMPAACMAAAAAAAWELAAGRRRWHSGAHPARSFTGGGWRAYQHASYGAVTAIGCVRSCWALMAVCTVFAHSIPVMVVLFAVQMSGRHRLRRPHALVVAAVLAVCAWAIAARLPGVRLP
jgi:hypothetical protein